MITSIVFSKDRALQLDLALNSIKKNFDLCGHIVVIYEVSNEGYNESYRRLKEEHSDVLFERQGSSLFLDIMIYVNDSKLDYICFFTDDDVIYNKVDFKKDQLEHIFEIGCCCLSLRLGLNTLKRDYGNGILRDDSIPQLFSKPPFIIWNRTGIPVGGYWAYPLSVDGHIFKRETIFRYCSELELLNRHYLTKRHTWKQTPNEFESKLQRFYFDLPPMMSSMKSSCVVNSPNNRVQSTTNNRHGDQFGYTASDLNSCYSSGKRIKLENIEFGDIVCPHQEIDILQGIVS